MAAIESWSNEKAESVKHLCDGLIEAGSLMSNNGKGKNNAILQYRRAALSSIKLKHFNREIHYALENKKKQVEKEKEIVETLKLKLENVLYKKAYLKREIRVLKDFTTPQLNAVEKEIGRPLAAMEYSSATELSNIEIAVKIIMEEEIVGRQETSKKLEDLAVIRANKEEILDKKRKFLDDIPSQMAAVLAATSDIKAQFESNNIGAVIPGSEEVEDDGYEEDIVVRQDDEGAFDEMQSVQEEGTNN